MHSMLFFIVLLCSFSMQAMPEESVARVAGSRRVKAKVNQSIENRAVTHVQTPQQEHARLSALLQQQIRQAEQQNQFASPIQINSASIVAPVPQYSLMTQKQLMEEHARLSALQEQQRKQLEMMAAQAKKKKFACLTILKRSMKDLQRISESCTDASLKETILDRGHLRKTLTFSVMENQSLGFIEAQKEMEKLNFFWKEENNDLSSLCPKQPVSGGSQFSVTY